MSSTEPEVRDVPEQRFEIVVDGVVAGLAAYVDAGEQRIFFHTEVDDAFAGRGLAGTLVRAALTQTRDRGLRIVPVCPYVQRWLASHGEEEGLAPFVDPVTRDALDAVARVTA